MKKFIRSSNDLLLSILMGAVAAFLLTNQKIIIGVENGLGGMWAQASTYIHLLAGILLAMAILQLIYAIDFKGAAEHKKLHIPVSKEIVITAAALVLYALLLPVLTFFPCTLALNIVLCATKGKRGERRDEGQAVQEAVPRHRDLLGHSDHRALAAVHADPQVRAPLIPGRKFTKT